MRDMATQGEIKLVTDASAAKGIAARRGLGQVRHIETNQLWLQQKVHNGEIIVEKCSGNINIADSMTKHVNGESHKMHVERTAIEFREGRHELAPKVSEEVWDEEMWEDRGNE